ncbi:glycosyltransferase family 4 protein [Gracilibacillus phocaeensis]|uniref:glycosyltransferase family 4 protein n=1 Tax=Gracilibacillus phocaeensis TaxID=2042304 RepID=UPI0010317765|nr:glycosyltransferase family 4 protein [Gracilibacillus phocaeensis]
MKKNIVIICYKYPPQYSGYGKQLKSILDKIDAKSLHITLLTMHPSSIVEKQENLDIIPLNKNHKGISIYLFSLRVCFWLLKNKKKYSIIHCIKAGPEAISANIVSKIFSKKLIVKVAQDELSKRELGNSKGLIRLNRKLRHLLLSNVDNFVAISEEISNNLKKIASKKTKILRIPNGVDTEKFKPLVEHSKASLKLQLGIETDNKPILLFAGAINKRKGIHNLLEALENSSDNDNMSYTFIFCGPILENINFEERIEQLNMNPNIDIYFMGNVENINEYMKISNIFVLPSYSEGLPNVLLEAAASGLALISTDIGGSRDIVDDNKNGFLVQKNNPHELAEKIHLLVNDFNKINKFANHSRRVAVEKFALNAIAKEYNDLYEDL